MKDEITKRESYVKYRNAFNRASLGGLSVVASNLLMAIAAKIVNHGTEPVYFTDSELATEELIGNRSLKDVIDALSAISSSLVKISCTIETEDYIDQCSVFQRFHIDKRKDAVNRLTVIVQPEFTFLFNDLQENFTVFELRDFASLRSTRAKTLYRFLKQFRTTGQFYMSLEDAFTFFNIPKKYREKKKYVKDKILDPATKECSRFFEGLAVQSIKAHSRGNPVTGYKWTFKAEKTKKKPAKKASRSVAVNGYSNYDKPGYNYDDLERQLANSPNN